MNSHMIVGHNFDFYDKMHDTKRYIKCSYPGIMCMCV